MTRRSLLAAGLPLLAGSAKGQGNSEGRAPAVLGLDGKGQPVPYTLRGKFSAQGARFRDRGKERLLLQGVLDQDGASAPVIVLRDVSGRCRIEKTGAAAATVTFDGKRRPVTRGPGSAGAAGALESLAFDCIEGLAGYLARGWSLSLLGERFAASEAEMNQGPWYDVYRIMPPPGGDGTEVETSAKLWYFDSDTELLRMVRYSDPQFSGGDAITRLSDWRKQDGEYVAGKIERLRGGQMVLSFRMTGTQILTDTGDNPFDSAA